MLGLRDGITALLFDLDGVLTKTAEVHAAAWKEMFDGVLAEHADDPGVDGRPFDPKGDYHRYVDGKPRYDGVRDFLASRGIHPPEGSPDDGRSRRRSAASAIARTTPSSGSSPRRASTRTRARSDTCTRPVTPASGSRW